MKYFSILLFLNKNIIGSYNYNEVEFQELFPPNRTMYNSSDPMVGGDSHITYNDHVSPTCLFQSNSKFIDINMRDMHIYDSPPDSPASSNALNISRHSNGINSMSRDRNIAIIPEIPLQYTIDEDYSQEHCAYYNNRSSLSLSPIASTHSSIETPVNEPTTRPGRKQISNEISNLPNAPILRSNVSFTLLIFKISITLLKLFPII